MQKNNNTPEIETTEKKTIKNLLGKAKETIVKAVDQNSDGTLDMKDVSVIAGAIGNAAKTTANAMKTSAEERARENEFKTLRPIFPEDIERTDFHVSKLIRITEIDKRRAESTVCKGSVGYISDLKELKIVNIYKDNLNLFRLKLIPNDESELYYVDPTDRDCYIALDEYFDRLKEARVNELQKIAQDLGAKYFRVTYKEEKSTFSRHSFKTVSGAKIPPLGHADAQASHDRYSNEAATVSVAAEMHCPGHEPFEPTVLYLQNETSIQTLIALRMDKSSPLTHQKYTLKLSNSSGIKESDAVKIDTALKALKISGNTTLQNEVSNESRRFFEYEIDF